MTVRAKALAWMKRKGRASQGDVRTSKFYVATESWTGEDAWWIQIPLDRLDKVTSLDLLLEKKPGVDDFHHLRVPTRELQAELGGLAVVGDETISLFLSAEPRDLFRDRRGSGKVRFAKWAQ